MKYVHALVAPVLIAVALATVAPVSAQPVSRGAATRSAACGDCALRLDGWLRGTLRDTLFDLVDRNNAVLIRNVHAVSRASVQQFGRAEQALHVFYYRNGVCADTVLQLADLLMLRQGNVGGNGAPAFVPLRPAREFFCGDIPKEPSNFFLEVVAVGGYGGADDSRREIGFSSIYGGAQVLAGFEIATDLRAAAGLDLLSEGGRLRIPLLLHLRWTLLGGSHSEEYFKYIPSQCQFGAPGDAPATPDDARCQLVPTGATVDSSVYFVHDVRQVEQGFRPFLYGEAGVIFNGGFDGAGPDPSVNPSEYGQYLLGAGVGVPIVSPLTFMIGFRHMRLNLRTPCATCEDTYIVNTNAVNSLLVALGLTF